MTTHYELAAPAALPMAVPAESPAAGHHPALDRQRSQCHKSIAVLIQVSLCLLLATPGVASVAGTDLKCEYKIDPLGIDVTSPRLSWKVNDAHHARGQEQTAYQILVASSLDSLNGGIGDLWDSGRVSSGSSVNIPYGGSALVSEQACFWMIRLWDKDGGVSPYSSPAKWSMGLLNTATDWKAQWIAHTLPSIALTRTQQREAGTSYTGTWVDEADRSITNTKNASMTFSFDGTFVQWIGKKDANRGIAEVFIDGVKEADVDCYSATAQNEQALFTKQYKLWPGAHALTIKCKGERNEASSGNYVDIDYFNHAQANPNLPPASYWRKDFATSNTKTIKRATVYATALGAYELHLNGRRVGEDYFNPGWTHFTNRLNQYSDSKACRVYYHAYDVTKMLASGTNAIGAILSTGWYAGYIWAGTFNYGPTPELMLRLKIEYADNTSDIIITDASWKHTYDGPTREADIQQGEIYDARLKMDGWDRYGYNDATWKAPDSLIDADHNEKFSVVIKVQAHPAQPIRKVEKIQPVAITCVGPGKHIVKFDRQISGWVEFSGANGPAGTRVKLYYSSAINRDGTLYTDHLRDMRGQDFYTLDGSGDERWEPKFTCHGFQYLEITGWPGTPELANFTAHLVHTDAPLVHSFDSSDPRVNKLDKMVELSIRTNTMDIPSACADRAERLGWMGDRNCLLETESYYLDTSAFLTKWMQDIADAQDVGVTGTFHQVCPIWGDIESAGWSEAGISLPYVMLKVYDDTALLNKHYLSLYTYTSYLDNKLDENRLRTTRMYHPDPAQVWIGYGDWLAFDQQREEDAPRFNTIHNFNSIRKMSSIAAATGRTADALYYKNLAADMIANFNKAWVDSDGVIVGESQSLYAMALDYGLIDGSHSKKVVDQFINEILNKSHVQAFADALGGYPTIAAGHLTTGFSGSEALLTALSRSGRTDTAYALLLKETFPSWIYCIENGMTAGWERWDSYTADKGFQSAAMNSFNLPAMHASIGEWLMGYAAGIRPDGNGFKKIAIKPYIGHGLSYIKASYDSPYGEISVHWLKNGDGSLDMRVLIPANSTAKIYVPNYDQIDEGGLCLWKAGEILGGATGIASATLEDDWVRFDATSGSYHFHASAQEVSVSHLAEGVTYSADWSHDTESESKVAGSSVSYTFTGTGIKWIGGKGIDRGMADVLIDGELITTIDAYSPTIQLEQELFSKIGLATGPHTITLRCKGQKHPAASGFFVGLTGLKVLASSAK